MKSRTDEPKRVRIRDLVSTFECTELIAALRQRIEYLNSMIEECQHEEFKRELIVRRGICERLMKTELEKQ